MELKTIKLQGKEYCQVVDRLKYFNKMYSDKYYLKTKVRIESSCYLFQASIYTHSGDKCVCTGHALKKMSAEFNLEKAETRAIGRCLGIFGIGTDGSISSYEEVREATNETK